MDLTQLIEALSRPSAYPHPVEVVEVRHTHVSVVFLAGPFAYKVKKSVALGFLDFSTLEKRRHFCEEEVRLNRRLAPTVYLGVVPVSRTGAGVRVEGGDNVVEWAVKMERLPEEATLQERLHLAAIDPAALQSLAQRIASFHASAETGDRISAFGQFEVVARNARENFDQAAPQVGLTVSRAVYERLRTLTEETLNRQHSLVAARARRGVPRDTHGDLRLDHVYLFPERPPPGDLVVIDCIEFNERFRYADPVADVAFLVMDLKFRGRSDLARELADAYVRAANDEEGRSLLPFYTAYRACVRAKVEGFKLSEKEVPEAERRAALARSEGHWLLGLGELEGPGRRPCLVLVGGLPGTGKSTLARGLVEQAGFRLVRSDVVRKGLAGVPATQRARSGFDEGIYTPAWTEQTYAECLRQSRRLLVEGQRVVVDASFGEERRRRDFLDLAAKLAVPAVCFLCQAEPELVRHRLGHRQGDASDADWSIFQQAAERWDAVSSSTRQVLRPVSTGGTPEQACLQALGSLGELALLD